MCHIFFLKMHKKTLGCLELIQCSKPEKDIHKISQQAVSSKSRKVCRKCKEKQKTCRFGLNRCCSEWWHIGSEGLRHGLEITLLLQFLHTDDRAPSVIG